VTLLGRLEQHTGELVLHLVVPGEPVPKARARTFYDPRVRRIISKTPARTAAAEQRIAITLRAARPGFRLSPTARFSIGARFYLGGTGRGDIDNYLKLLCDALTGLVWSNDRQVRRVEYAELIDNCEQPRTEIMVWEIA
jgi:Holliday junction resolvase RusA-like endonuclease